MENQLSVTNADESMQMIGHKYVYFLIKKCSRFIVDTDNDKHGQLKEMYMNFPKLVVLNKNVNTVRCSSFKLSYIIKTTRCLKR